VKPPLRRRVKLPLPPPIEGSDSEPESEPPLPKPIPRIVLRRPVVPRVIEPPQPEQEQEQEQVARPARVQKNWASTITITYGDCAENHVGMQKMGQMATHGLTLKQLQTMESYFKSKGAKTELIMLAEAGELPEELQRPDTLDASVLIIRNGADIVLSQYDSTSDDMYEEQSFLEVDKKAKMKGRVVNKLARHNLCFDEEGQEPCYEEGKGRVVAFRDVPLTDAIRDFFVGKLQLGALKAEGNYYYDRSCGIGWHGDSERKIVIAVRLGHSMPLHYRWYHNRQPVGEVVPLILHHGDIYLMSAKAVGTDWKKYTQVTLRHAAGAAKYLAEKS